MAHISSVATNVNVIVEHTTFSEEEGAQEGTSAMSDVVDSSSSDKSFSRESTPCTLSEEVPSATEENANAFKDGEFTNTLPVPPFRPKGHITMKSATKPKPNGGK